jgi:hypothetical protein
MLLSPGRTGREEMVRIGQLACCSGHSLPHDLLVCLWPKRRMPIYFDSVGRFDKPCHLLELREAWFRASDKAHCKEYE